MSPDKYSAIWLSFSSITDFLNCPRAYYLKNIYRDPDSGNKIQIANPSLSLGSAVHEVIEQLSHMVTKDRLSTPFTVLLDRIWDKYTGKQGGFISKQYERKYKDLAQEMLSYVYQHPGPLKQKAIKIKMDLPFFWLSEEHNLILCGRIDWMEYLEDKDSVHIIDFKTGQRQEKKDSWQLPIYYMLAANCQNRPVVKQSYWYLAKKTEPEAQEIPNYDQAEKELIKIGLKIKTARQLNSFNCPHGGCNFCRPFEQILKHQAELVGISTYGANLYLLDTVKTNTDNSVIL